MKAIVPKLGGESKDLSQFLDIKVFYLVLSHWMQCLTVHSNGYSLSFWPQMPQQSALIRFSVVQIAIIKTNHTV